MVLAFVAILLAVASWQVIVARRAHAGRRGGRSATVGFLAWAVAGLLAAGSAASALSIGLFVAPLAIAAVWIAARLSPELPTMFGALSGAGLFLIAVAVLHTAGWALIGAGFVAVGVAGCLLTLRPRRRAPTG